MIQIIIQIQITHNDDLNDNLLIIYTETKKHEH